MHQKWTRPALGTMDRSRKSGKHATWTRWWGGSESYLRLSVALRTGSWCLSPVFLPRLLNEKLTQDHSFHENTQRQALPVIFIQRRTQKLMYVQHHRLQFTKIPRPMSWTFKTRRQNTLKSKCIHIQLRPDTFNLVFPSLFLFLSLNLQ